MRTKAVNEVTLAFPSRSRNEGFARSAAAGFAAQMDPTLNELEDIKTAVSEAVTNAIVHGYPEDIGPVILKIRVLEGPLRDYVGDVVKVNLHKREVVIRVTFMGREMELKLGVEMVDGGE